MIRSNRHNLRALAGAALLLGLATAAPGRAAEPHIIHQVELRDGVKLVTIEQRLIPTAGGTDVQLIARGPVTGAKTVAVMYADGELAVKVDDSWWADFFSANGVSGSAELIPRSDAGRQLAALAVTGQGGASHLIGVAMVDPDQPWGPCPGPDDAPTCRPEVVVIPFWCKFDVDQCSGGPLPWGSTDPDGDPASPFFATDPDGDPARGLAILRPSIDAGVLVEGNFDLGTTALPMDGGRWFDHRGPGF